MKKRVGGGIFLAAVILGIYLGSIWNLPGLGPNETTAPLQPQSDPSAEDQPSSSVSVKVPDNAPTTTQSEPDVPEMITIVVFADRYRLTSQAHPETGLELPLEDIINRAISTTGDASGTRVNIVLHRSAQEGARSGLYEALSQAGLKPGEIQENSEFLR